MYSKLFHKILDSSIWLEDHATLRVWITLLASMDETGMCQYASGLNLARRANVTTEEAAAAVTVLEAPDPHSSDRDNEGRRIQRVPGGWVVLNAPKYRAIVTRKESQRLNAERQQRYRDRKKNGVTNVTPRNETAERNASVTQARPVTQTDTDSSMRGKACPKEERRAALPLLPDGTPDYTADHDNRFAVPNGYDR